MQRTKMDQLNSRWEDLWELSRMYVERLKALEAVLNGIEEASTIIQQHEILLGSIDPMPSNVDKLRALHAQILARCKRTKNVFLIRSFQELNMTLQQQTPIMDELSTAIGSLRQHVARTRYNVADHPDVDKSVVNRCCLGKLSA